MPRASSVRLGAARVKVVIAEDSATLRRVLGDAVRELGHECLAAEDGEGAWELLRSEGADMVISDWVMPGLQGDELCRRVRATPGPYMYFVLLTSLEDKRHVMEGMHAGADDYLTKPLDRDELEARLTAATRVTELHRRLAQQQGELERLNLELYEQARRDPLTTVGNRLRMREDLEELEDRVARYGHTYAVVLCDVDKFKPYNDTAGHLAGDDVLRRIAQSLDRSCRRADAVYRYGGEELLVVLQEQDLQAAAGTAERMRRDVEAMAIEHPGLDPAGTVTISAGVAARADQPERGSDATLRRADAALYEAKAKGRNRVVALPPQSATPSGA
jgi:two-component system cell cycle response regulator